MKLPDKLLIHKYITDDITLTDLSISTTNKGHLQEAVHTIKKWSDNNNMRITERESKKMITSFKKNALKTQSILVNNKTIERVTYLKILGVGYLINFLGAIMFTI